MVGNVGGTEKRSCDKRCRAAPLKAELIWTVGGNGLEAAGRRLDTSVGSEAGVLDGMVKIE